MNHSIPVYLLVAAATIYLIRMLPMTLIRRDIKNPFIRSFLFYVPYVTLAVMTFPAILSSTASILSGAAALIVGVFLAYRGKSLIVVAVASSAAVLLTEFLMNLL